MTKDVSRYWFLTDWVKPRPRKASNSDRLELLRCSWIRIQQQHKKFHTNPPNPTKHKTKGQDISRSGKKKERSQKRFGRNPTTKKKKRKKNCRTFPERTYQFVFRTFGEGSRSERCARFRAATGRGPVPPCLPYQGQFLFLFGVDRLFPDQRG